MSRFSREGARSPSIHVSSRPRVLKHQTVANHGQEGFLVPSLAIFRAQCSTFKAASCICTNVRPYSSSKSHGRQLAGVGFFRATWVCRFFKVPHVCGSQGEPTGKPPCSGFPKRRHTHVFVFSHFLLRAFC